MRPGGQDIQIRSLTIKDYDQMVQLWRRSGLSLRAAGRDSKEAIEAQMEDDPNFFLGAFEDSSLVATIIVSSDGRKGWLNRLAVSPEYRRRGIAKALITEAEKVLRERGIRVFSALIWDPNESSKSLFEDLGYRELKNIKYFSKRDSEEV